MNSVARISDLNHDLKPTQAMRFRSSGEASQQDGFAKPPCFASQVHKAL
jgi:hypothetical protein